MNGLSVIEIIEITITDSFFGDSSGMKTAVFCSCFSSFRRCCGFFNAQFHIAVNGEDMELDQIQVKINSESYIIERGPSDDPFLYAQWVFYALVKYSPYLSKVSQFFFGNALWETEIEYLYMKYDDQIQMNLLYKVDNLLERCKFDEDNEHMSYLAACLEVMEASILVQLNKERRFKNYIKQIVRDALDIVCGIARRYPKNPLFYGLQCELSELLGNKHTVHEYYNAYIDRLEQYEKDFNIKTDWECSIAFYKLGRFIEHNTVDESQILKLGRSKFLWKYSRELDEIYLCYLKSLTYVEENYRSQYKLILSGFGDSKEDIVDNLKELYISLDLLTSKGQADLIGYIYQYKVLYNAGAIQMQMYGELRQAIELFEKAEQLFEEKIMRYIKIMMNHNKKGEEEINREVESIKEYLNIMLLYQNLKNAYIQKEGVYSVLGNEYGRKYYRLVAENN